jgi:hypothetical protein
VFKSTVIKKMKILDFDIENRPLTYMGNDYTSAEVTAIAASWGLDKPVYCWLLGRDKPEEMLLGFLEMYDQADIVTGHYIRNHDLPIVNGALIELGLGTLSEKLTSDTKNDCITFSDISKSQESIADTLGVHNPKIHMSQHGWRAANRLTPEGISLAEERCVGDVRQHQELRLAMIDAEMLRPPKMWKPLS